MRWRLSPFKGYLISSCGKVWSCKRKIFLGLRPDKDGYLKTQLRVNGEKKNMFVKELREKIYAIHLKYPSDIYTNYKTGLGGIT